MGNLLENMSSGDIIVGILNFLTMFFSNFALKFVNYPFMVLAKSAKILPVILTGWIRGIYVLTWSQVLIAITISSGLVIFNSGKMQGLEEESGNLTGICLVLLSLLLDGFVNSQTDKNHKTKKRDFAYPTMFYNNLVGLIGNASFYLFNVVYGDDTTHERVS
jgi:drug/metabolite transporter (DMT)-like permease